MQQTWPKQRLKSRSPQYTHAYSVHCTTNRAALRQTQCCQMHATPTVGSPTAHTEADMTPSHCCTAGIGICAQWLIPVHHECCTWHAQYPSLPVTAAQATGRDSGKGVQLAALHATAQTPHQCITTSRKGDRLLPSVCPSARV